MSTVDADEANEIEIECDIPPDLPNYTCIQYPGKVNNINNAIGTLGGNDKIQQTFIQFNEFEAHKACNEKKKTKTQTSSKPSNCRKEPYLELHLNPNGVFDHALFGKIRPVKNCILIKKTTRIAKKRRLNEMNAANNNNHKSELEVMGRITSMVTYDELCDFQVFSDLHFPKKIVNNNDTINDKDDLNIIRKSNKRRRIWSLSEDDIPNISKYPLVPQVFASKATPYDDILKRPANKPSKSATKQQTLETKPTEIMFRGKTVPRQPKKGSIWLKWWQDLTKYLSDTNNRNIPQSNNKLSKNEKDSFCRKIRNELVLQIKSYFEQQPIWSKTEILLQKFYIFWYHIKYFTQAPVTQPNENKNMKMSDDTFYDFDIASIVLEKLVLKEEKKNFYLSNTNNTDLENCTKIYLDLKEKEKLISKFLGIVGYKFKNGPFRNSFIKFGFDPRCKDNKTTSRPLQILDYRISKVNGKQLGIESSWSGGRIGKRGKPNTQKTRTSAAMYALMSSQRKPVRNERFLAQEMCADGLLDDMFDVAQNAEYEKVIMERLQFKIKPEKLQSYYQLRNIDIAEVQELIYNEAVGSYNDECLKDCGWFLKKDETKIRELMHQRLEVWMVREGERKKKEAMIASLSAKRRSRSPLVHIREDSQSLDVHVNENEEEKMMELDEMVTVGNESLNRPYDVNDSRLNDDDDCDVFNLL